MLITSRGLCCKNKDPVVENCSLLLFINRMLEVMITLIHFCVNNILGPTSALGSLYTVALVSVVSHMHLRTGFSSEGTAVLEFKCLRVEWIKVNG